MAAGDPVLLSFDEKIFVADRHFGSFSIMRCVFVLIDSSFLTISGAGRSPLGREDFPAGCFSSTTTASLYFRDALSRLASMPPEFWARARPPLLVLRGLFSLMSPSSFWFVGNGGRATSERAGRTLGQAGNLK